MEEEEPKSKVRRVENNSAKDTVWALAGLAAAVGDFGAICVILAASED